MLGLGLIKGLIVTARNFFGSYFSKEQLVTVPYPEGGDVVTESYRNMPFLVYDGDDPVKGIRCVACKICELECPPQCIYIVLDQDKRGNLIERPKIYDLDISVCMGCQICVETCPFDAIKMDTFYELSTDDRFEGMLLHREQLLKSNAYFHRIHPTEATGVDTLRAQKVAFKHNTCDEC